MKKLIIILIASASCMAFSCVKEEPEWEEISFTFVLPMTVNPVQSTYHIGDTIWLEASFSDSIYERTTDKKYRFVDFDFASSIYIFKLLGRPTGSLYNMPFGGTQFDLYPVVGNTFPLNSGAAFDFKYHSNTYFCRIGIIPKFRGLFSFYAHTRWISDQTQLDLSFIDLGKTPEGGKRVPYLQGIYYVSNVGIDNNFDMYKNNCITAYELIPDTLSILWDQSVFTFEVVE